ncbi:MAG: hypothetical protein ACUVQ4_09440 [bacterium]
MKTHFEFDNVSIYLVILCLLISLCQVNSSLSLLDANFYHIGVKAGDWVEYKVRKVIEKAIIPNEFKDAFPKNWTSMKEGDLILVMVLETTVVDFGNYSREFAIFNVTFNDKPLIPFWFYESIVAVQQLPLDGFFFFLPVNESYWSCLEDMVEFWKDKVSQQGALISYDVRKCFYRIRADHFLFGWVEVSANFDNYLGVLKDFSIRFLLTPDFVNEVRQRIGTIIVDGEPFEIQANKQYGLEITLNDSNIPQLVNNIEFGQAFAELLDRAIKDGAVGAIITVRSQIAARTDVLVEYLDVSVYVTSERVIIDLTSTLPEGTIFIVNVWKEAFPIQWWEEFQVLFDGKLVGRAENYDDVLNLLNGKEVEYFVVIGSKFVQVTISIPHFSSHTIEIVKVPSLTAQLILFFIIACALCLVAVGVHLLRRIKHRSKQ